jgi:DNA primase large subunit
MPMPLTKPSIDDEALMARYPFLPQGATFLRVILEKNGITVEDLIEAHWLEEVRSRGRVRLLESVMHKEGVDSATTIDLSSDLGKMTESLSFFYAMLVVCASFNERLLARWVEGEASRADQLFGMDKENFDILARSYLSDIKEVRERAGGEVTYWVPISDFIELCPRISGNYWRLINRPLKEGWVCMNSGAGESSRKRTARLIKERIREDLTNSCVERMNKMDDSFAQLFIDPVERVTKLLSEQVKEEMPMNASIRADWPPCFESAVGELSQGVNVNHTGRLFLASMSLAMGLSQEQTCGFFANAPDYNADTTSYQINQIFEGKYTPHGCAALKTSARCPVSPGDDRLCDQEWLTHPLKYLKAKQRRRFQETGETVITDKTE